MRRRNSLAALDRRPEADVAVIGGGATGLGVAVDAAARGYRTVLLERGDFAQETSSRSTKLVHGGVRYLRQGDVSLVIEALHERGTLRTNAPHLVHDLRFVVPSYDWWQTPFYGIGLKVYDLLAGKHGFGDSEILDVEETVERLPTIEREGLRGGVLYYDGQFDDARLAINLAQTAADHGALVLNYAPVRELIHDGSLVAGLRFEDRESGRSRELRARAVVNATGVFTDQTRRMDDSGVEPIIRASQGAHLVLDRSFLPGDSAILVPRTEDGRVLFAIPWRDRVLVGTTDTPIDEPTREPRPLPEEIRFLLRHCARYLARDPGPEDVLSAFAGLRPLVGEPGTEDTAEISRDHVVTVSRSGLVSVAGGKWTTYRKMAAETVSRAAQVAGLPEEACPTANLPIHGACDPGGAIAGLEEYGSDGPAVLDLDASTASGIPESPEDTPHLRRRVLWAIREEMARTVEDVLSRRLRLLLLDARASERLAPAVASVMAAELDRDRPWVRAQVRAYQELVGASLPPGEES